MKLSNRIVNVTSPVWGRSAGHRSHPPLLATTHYPIGPIGKVLLPIEYGPSRVRVMSAARAGVPLSPVHEEAEEDAEWDDFDRLLTEYKVRRRNVLLPSSPELARRYMAPQQESAFYPCPPPSAPQDPLDPYSEYVATDSVRLFGHYGLNYVILDKLHTLPKIVGCGQATVRYHHTRLFSPLI